MEKFEKKYNQSNETRDTSGDTKVFKIIKPEDIEKEKARQATLRENSSSKIKETVQRDNNKGDNIIIKKERNVNVVSKKNGSSNGNIAVKNDKNNVNVVSQKKKNTMNNVIEGSASKSSLNLEAQKSKINNENIIEKNDKNIKDNVRVDNNIKKVESNNVQREAKTSEIKKSIIVVDKEKNKIEKKNSEKNIKEIKNDSSKYEVKSSKKDGLILGLVLIIIILIIVVLSTIFAVINMNSNKIIKGIKVNQIELSELTKEEAVQKLNNILNNDDVNYVTVKHGDLIKQVKLSEINGKFDVENVVNDAYNCGREKDIISNNYLIILILIKGKNYEASFSYDEEMLMKKINEICIDIPDLATDSSYIIQDNKLVIKNSKSGVAVKTDEFKNSLLNAFLSDSKEFELPVEHIEKKEVDIDAIHDEIYKEAVNAYYTTEPRKIYKEENGLDFEISVEEIKKLLNENKDEYEIKLKTVKPQVTVANLDSGAFPDVLGTFTTTYGTGDANRNTNIALAAKSINSAVLMPGDTFSYNDLIGDCSIKSGYKAATIYENGKLSTGVGGGICQVSTTLYNAVLRANLEIVQRRNHSLGVTYVPAGQDAMVNIGTSDFKFKNNRDYPIKVVAYVGTGSVTCQIIGLKQDVEYDVKLESKTIESTDTKYKVETYKVLYQNGKVISRTWLSTDIYKRHQ